jgi:hypothetical protein
LLNFFKKILFEKQEEKKEKPIEKEEEKQDMDTYLKESMSTSMLASDALYLTRNWKGSVIVDKNLRVNLEKMPTTKDIEKELEGKEKSTEYVAKNSDGTIANELMKEMSKVQNEEINNDITFDDFCTTKNETIKKTEEEKLKEKEARLKEIEDKNKEIDNKIQDEKKLNSSKPFEDSLKNNDKRQEINESKENSSTNLKQKNSIESTLEEKKVDLENKKREEKDSEKTNKKSIININLNSKITTNSKNYRMNSNDISKFRKELESTSEKKIMKKITEIIETIFFDKYIIIDPSNGTINKSKYINKLEKNINHYIEKAIDSEKYLHENLIYITIDKYGNFKINIDINVVLLIIFEMFQAKDLYVFNIKKGGLNKNLFLQKLKIVLEHISKKDEALFEAKLVISGINQEIKHFINTDENMLFETNIIRINNKILIDKVANKINKKEHTDIEIMQESENKINTQITYDSNEDCFKFKKIGEK